MSNYLSVPDSSVKLKEGNVVMLQRFPGTKWVVHNGWYSYNGRNYTGWYFASIPAQTVMPVNQFDLQGIVVVANADSIKHNTRPDMYPVPYPEYPVHPGPHPGPYPGPCPDDHFGPNPYPPMPPGPHPGPGPTPGLMKLVNSTFITVEKMRELDMINTEIIPDGRYVCVNSVNGERKYFRWNERDDKWDEVDPIAIINGEIDKALESYTDSEGVAAAIEEAKEELHQEVEDVSEHAESNTQSISALSDRLDEVESQAQEAIQNLSDKEAEDVATLTEITDLLQSQIDDIREVIANNKEETDDEIAAIKERLDALEEAVFNIKRLADVLDSNTILVYNNGSLSDSGFAIGDENIGEIAEYANDHTVATEKAVAELVERSQPKWTSF